MKKLIAFYSRSGMNYANGGIVNLPVGNTEVAAAIIKKLTDADLIKIDTVKPYPVGYEETTEVAKVELRQNARPELTGAVQNMQEYQVVFLGYPNWWGTMPMAVFTFLEQHDLSGKTIIPFCTHEGSGMGRSEKDLAKVCPNAKIAKGLAITGGKVASAESDIALWLGKLGQNG